MASKRGHPLERGAVAGAGGHGHHRGRGDAADQAGQRPLHAGHHHDGVGLGELVDARPAAGAARPPRSRPAGWRRSPGRRARPRTRGPPGRSAVPAVMTSDRAGRGGAGRHTTVARRPLSVRRRGRGRACAARRPTTALHLAPRSARVRSTGPAGAPPAAPPRWPRTAPASCPVRRPLRACPGAGPVVVDLGEAQVGEGEAAQPAHRVVGGAAARGDVVEEARSAESSMTLHYPARP